MSLSARHSAWCTRVVHRWRTRVFSLHHAHVKIAKGIGWTLLFVVMARLVGAGREMALAAHYGVSETIDAYLFVFNLVSWPFTVWFNVLSMVLVPMVIRLRHSENGKTALQHFRAGLLGLSIVIGIAFAFLFWWLFSSGLLLSYTGLPASTAIFARDMSYWLMPIVPLGFVASFYSAWVMATGRYVNTLIEAITPLAILLVILVFSNGNVAPLLLGTLLGFILHVSILAMVLGRMGEATAPAFNGQGPEWRQFWKSFAVMATGNAFITAAIVVDQLMAAVLEPGTIATLGYANRIIALIMSLSTFTVGRAILPIFSGMHAAADPHLPRVAVQWTAILFVGGAVAAVAAWWCAPTLIALLFQRGAFTADNTRAVSELFSFALIQIPFFCGGLTLNVQLAASGRYGVLAWLAVASLTVKIVMNCLLIPPFGAAGIVLATAAMYAFSFLARPVLSRY